MIQNFPSYDLVNKAANKLLEAKENEPVTINGHEVIFDRGGYRVGTEFGDLIYANPADAARFCLCVDVTDNDEAKELGKKYDDIDKRVKRLETENEHSLRSL